MTKPIRIVYDVLSEIMCAPYPAGAYFLMAGTDLAMDRMTPVIFIGIASMTHPHVAVIAIAQRDNVLGNRLLMLPVWPIQDA